MNNLYKFLRCAVMMAILLPTTLCGQITLTTDSNGNGTIEDSEKILYLIQSYCNEAFYMRDNSRNNTPSKVNTSNIVTANSEWYFLDGGTFNDIQYYYIVHNATNKYVYLSSEEEDTEPQLKDAPTSGQEDYYRFKFVLNSTRSAYNILVKLNDNTHSLNKNKGNSQLNNIRQFSVDNDNSCWNFIAKADYTKTTCPLDLSTLDGEKHYYNIQNNREQTLYMNQGSTYVVSDNTFADENDRVWYFVKAAEDDYLDYYYIVHPKTGKYLRYKGNNGDAVTDAVQLYNLDLSEQNKFLFIIVPGSRDDETHASTISSSTYCIAPKIPMVFRVENTVSLCTKNDNQGTNNGQNLRAFKERNGNDHTHWNFIPTVYSTACISPTITYSSETGKITIATNTADAEIHYTTDGVTEPSSNEGTLYSGPFDVSAPVTIKAIATKTSYPDSGVTTLFFDQVATPSFELTNDGKVRLTCSTDGVDFYYEMGADPNNPTTSSTHYVNPIENAAGQYIKAIAVKDGMINSAVATSAQITLSCATPVIRKTSATTFTITCSFPTSGVTIYYNIGDGTQAAPTNTTGTLYQGEVTFDPDNLPFTVKAIAYATDYSNSDVATNYIQGNDYSQNYLTFNVLTSGEIPWKSIGSGMAKEISYRINGGSWTPITAGSDVTISVNAGDVVQFKGNNQAYAKDKNNYSGFEGGTATFNIEGNIHSLLYGDDFASNNSLTNSTYQFCSLFKKANVVSAENLILPATTLKTYCYRALFSWCTTLTTPPALPATTLAQGCYWYMFEQCAISTAPELNVTTLVNECYGHMFEGCGSLNYVKCMATNISATDCTLDWLKTVSSTGTFVKEANTTWPSGASGIPNNWTQYNDFLLYSPEIDCDGENITITCATEGASIYYRLNQTGDFSLYSSPIVFNSNTTVEAYSSKGNNTSNTVIITFEKYDNPFDESTRSINSWTYGNTQVTLPFSVNGIDGHSSSYSRGTHTFETTITLYKLQPTCLWFQHADQSADIYVDDVFVTTHWGGYNAFFVDISNYVHVGTNRIKVVLNNTSRNYLAPVDGDFNFNATLGKVVLLTSPVLPDKEYGYDGFHITATDVSNSSATITVKTKIPVGASVVCEISDGNYTHTETKNSTGSDMTFTTTITGDNLVLWNGTKNPHLYTVTLEIYKDNELYHRYQRPYGFRYYSYEPSTGFLLNGQPYLLRGVCVHHDLEGKANALDDSDIANDFNIIKELGCNFLRLAHYPHPKEIYDWCDSLGIIVQTEVPCVNKFQSQNAQSGALPEDYYNHLVIQYDDMVKQHYNHPCIMFWGLGNEITTDDRNFAKTKLEAFRTQIKTLDPERWVGYVVSHSYSNPSSAFNDPNMDWFGCNIYVGWYIDKDTNNPTKQLNTRKANIISNLGKPLAFSEYGCGGTQNCHSEKTHITTTKGNYARHDIEYQMWLHEGHIAAIRNFPELLFTSQWQLFDIAVSKRTEGYTICHDGLTTSTDDNLKYLNNKGLVERDHQTKKDPFYLYKAWWNETDKFVHICGKDYEKLTNRVIKCYTNDGNSLSLYVNNTFIETVSVTDNIATFTARNFSGGDVIRVNGETAIDTFTFPTDWMVYDQIFQTAGDWNVAANWSNSEVPAAGSNVLIAANATIPSGYVANADRVFVDGEGSLTIADGGQLYHNNEGAIATVQKNITSRNNGGGWNFIASPVPTVVPSTANGLLSGDYDLYYYHEGTHKWRNYKGSLDENHANPGFSLTNGKGYLYANTEATTLSFTGALGTHGMVALDFNTDEGAVLPGWNLVGNPFPCNVTSSLPYYLIDGSTNQLNGTAYQAGTTIPSCTGIMVKAEASSQSVTFAKVVAQQSNLPSGLQIAVAQANTRTNTAEDKAIVSFSEGNQLEKFIFDADLSKLYIPQDGKDYAIVSVGRDVACYVSTVDVNFKAAENGPYTITVNPENVEMGYLHLIDNMTSADVDLLTTPTYTFSAKTTDYASRFRLVFSGNEADGPSTGSGTFAFINNGNIVFTGMGGDAFNASLQIVDMMGRVIVYRDAVPASLSTNGIAPGVYVLRLINGNDVKTQKIVVR